MAGVSACSLIYLHEISQSPITCFVSLDLLQFDVSFINLFLQTLQLPFLLDLFVVLTF